MLWAGTVIIVAPRPHSDAQQVAGSHDDYRHDRRIYRMTTRIDQVRDVRRCPDTDDRQCDSP